MAHRTAKVLKESKLPMEEEDYVKTFKVELMDAVMQWCRGASFSDICKVVGFFFVIHDFVCSISMPPPQLTDVFEGSVIAFSGDSRNSFAR